MLVLISMVLILTVVAVPAFFAFRPWDDSSPGHRPPGPVPLEPEVRVTGMNYSDAHYSEFRPAHANFSRTYAVSDLTVELKNNLVRVMMDKARHLGEDPLVLESCLEHCGFGHGTLGAPDKIPCYAEMACYRGTPVWIIAFNTAQGTDLGHFEVVFVSTQTFEIVRAEYCD